LRALAGGIASARGSKNRRLNEVRAKTSGLIQPARRKAEGTAALFSGFSAGVKKAPFARSAESISGS